MDDTNQHFISKAYLDKFVHPDSSQHVLFPYRKGGRPCRERGTKRLGSAINFYRQRENGILNDKLDEAREKSENMLFASGTPARGSLANCIFDDNFVPRPQDKLHLAAAAAFLFCGSPVQIHNTAMHALLYNQMRFLNLLNTPEALEACREAYGAEAEARLEEDRKKVLKGELFVDVGEENWKQLGFQSFIMEEDAIKLLMNMQMTIVNCHRNAFFLTSDNPVVRTYALAQDFRTVGGAG